jgi:1-phosphofructokinase
MTPTFDAVTVTLNPAIDRTLTISRFDAGQVNRVEDERSRPGGKGVNVASALADFGRQVAVTGLLGRDNAWLFEDLFAGKQIADHFVRLAGSTRTGIKITDPVLQQTTDINFPGATPTQTELDELYTRLGGLEARWFVLSGSLPPGVDAAIYHNLISLLRKKGARVLLDASGPALPLALEAIPHIIKPNLSELEEMAGKTLRDDLSVIAAVQPWLDRGEVASTVGAGDAMVAGIIAARIKGLSLPECARLATAFSVDAITHTGTGLSSPSAVKNLLPQITVEDIS